jgi:hypothetical protein
MGTLRQSKLPTQNFYVVGEPKQNSLRGTSLKENECKGDPNCIICGKLENA